MSDSAQTAFALKVLASGLSHPSHYTPVVADVNAMRWLRVFGGTRVNAVDLCNRLVRQRKHIAGIRELLMAQSASSISRSVERGAVFESIRSLQSSSDNMHKMTAHKYELLRQLQIDQQRSDRVWRDCELVATLLYNIAVAQNAVSRFELRRRSHLAIKRAVQDLSASRPPTPASGTQCSHSFFSLSARRRQHARGSSASAARVSLRSSGVARRPLQALLYVV